MARRQGLDDVSARRLALASAAADCAIDELRENVYDAMIAFVSAVAPDLEGKARLDFAVMAMRSMATGLEKSGAELLREKART